MKEIKLSIIIPIYNVEHTINKILKNIIKQYRDDIEIIAVNDGSTDYSINIIRKYEKLIKIVTQDNKGVSEARNIGIQHATGEYITFIDSDDAIDLGYFENIIDIIQKEKCNLLIYGYKEKNIIDKTEKTFVMENNENSDEKDIFLHTFNYGVYWMAVWNKVYKREYIYKLKFDKKLTNGEDFEFNISFLKNINFKKIYFCTKSYYYYNVEKGIYKYRQNSIMARIKIYNALIDLSKNDKLFFDNLSYYFWNSVIYDLLSIIMNQFMSKNEKIKEFEIIKRNNNFKEYRIANTLSIKKRIISCLIKSINYKYIFYLFELYVKLKKRG